MTEPYPQLPPDGPVCSHGFPLGHYCRMCEDYDAVMVAQHGPLWFLQGAKISTTVPGGAIG